MIHWHGKEPRDNRFYISTHDKSRYITEDLTLGKHGAAEFSITDGGNGAEYAVVNHKSGKHLSTGRDGSVSWADNNAGSLELFSLTE